jgi:LEA14-like dessication related protein
VVVDSGASPKLKARAILYNPNDTRIKLKKIDVEIFIAGKKAGAVNQDLKLVIPPKDEFFIDLEVLLSLKEINFVDAIFGVLGTKKLQVEYKGYLKISYHGLPMKVPVNYKDEIRMKF